MREQNHDSGLIRLAPYEMRGKCERGYERRRCSIINYYVVWIFNSSGVVLYLFGYRGFHPRLFTLIPLSSGKYYLSIKWMDRTRNAKK